MVLSTYPASGFHLVSAVSESGLKKRGVLTAITITRGEAIIDSGGYATNGGTDFAATFLGIAAETVDNSAGASGAKDVMFYPPFPQNQFVVAADTTVLAQTDIGELCDLGATAFAINPADNVTTGVAFVIDDIDISAAALAADAQGFALGHFEMGRAAQT